MPFHQPRGIAIGSHIADLHLRHCNGRLVRDQQMERQRGERARGPMRSWGLSLISASTGPNSAPYSSCAAARSNSWALPIETDFVSSSTSRPRRKAATFADILLAERNRPPLETLASKRKNVAFVGPCKEEYKCFVAAKQLLHLFRRERLRMCDCRIIGKFLVETCGNRVKAALDLGDLLAQRVGAYSVLLTLGIRKRIEQCLVLVAPGGGEVLPLPHQEPKAPPPDANRLPICWRAAAAED